MSDACCGTDSCHTVAPAPPVNIFREHARELWILAGAGTAIGLGAIAASLSIPQVVLPAYLVAIGLCIPGPARRAWTSIRRAVLDINVLMVVAVAGAAALGEWFEAAAVVWLFGVAQQLELISMERARQAIRSLMVIAPASALVRRDGKPVQIPASDVEVGDVLMLRPGDRLPVDGIIASGESAFDESPVTGESRPIEKDPGFHQLLVVLSHRGKKRFAGHNASFRVLAGLYNHHESHYFAPSVLR